MSVRAKMTCQSAQAGRVGKQANFTAVYEGSSALQKISENAIFGDATPAGNMAVFGDVPEFQDREEYYLDLYAPGEAVRIDDALLSLNLRKIYRSEPDPNFVTSYTLFRFAVTDQGVSGSLDMSIGNPAAVDALDASEIWGLIVRLARGRRSDVEISMIEKMLAERTEHAGREWDRAGEARASGDEKMRARFYDGRLWTLDRAAYIGALTDDLVKKLARARGRL